MKRRTTAFLGAGGGNAAPIVGATIEAAGGLERQALGGLAAGRSGGSGAGGAGGGSSRQPSLAGAVSGLGGFGTGIATGDLDTAIRGLGLSDLRGRSAIEVIGRVAEHISRDADGVLGELLANALKESLLEAAALVNDTSYEDLEASLTAYLQRDGVDGLVELFLTRYVTDSVWALIENHAQDASSGESALDGMALAVENACREHVRNAIEDERTAGSFESTDWFGGGGQAVAGRIISTIEQRLRNATEEPR